MSYAHRSRLIINFDYHKFGSQLRYIRQTQMKRTVRDVQQDTGISYDVISMVERGKRKDSIAIVLLAFWADMDLREYVSVKDLNPTQPQLFDTEPVQRVKSGR